MIKQLIFFFLLLSSLVLPAQDDHVLYEQYSHILIQNQNDFWKWRMLTERYFTNSIYIENISSDYYAQWKDNWFLRIFPKLTNADAVNSSGLGLGQDFYTPIDISELKVQLEDRPYSGFLYMNFKNISNSFTQSARLSSVYTIGVMGPFSFSKEVQKKFHAIKGSVTPRGWDNQIANDIGINLHLSFEKRGLHPIEYLDLIGYLDANVLSTVSNKLAIGLHYRFGLFNDYFTNTTGKKPNKELWDLLTSTHCSYYCKAIKRDWQLYGYIKTHLTSLLDNSFLEGGIFNRNSSHTLHTDNIERFYFQGEFGLRLSIQGFDLTYAQLFRTTEFEGANNSYWGKIQFIFSY